MSGVCVLLKFLLLVNCTALATNLINYLFPCQYLYEGLCAEVVLAVASVSLASLSGANAVLNGDPIGLS